VGAGATGRQPIMTLGTACFANFVAVQVLLQCKVRKESCHKAARKVMAGGPRVRFSANCIGAVR
jgi:hypothetical protein